MGRLFLCPIAIDDFYAKGDAQLELSGSFRKYGDTESGHRWMLGKDAGADVCLWHTRRRGRRPAPPGAPRMSSYLRNGPLRLSCQ